MHESDKSVNAQMLVDDLNDLVQLHYDVIAAYETAIPRLENPAYQKVFREFRDNHGHSIEALIKLVREYGGEPREKGDAAEPLAKARVMFGKLLNDEGVLQAMLANERKLDLEYSRDLASLTGLPGMESTLKRNRVDDSKRLAWIEGEAHMLKKMGERH